MKTALCTIIILLALNAGVFAGGGINPNSLATAAQVSEPGSCPWQHILNVPGSIGLSDGTEYKNRKETSENKLAPVTPREADFEDPGFSGKIIIGRLAPVVPKEPVFEDCSLLFSDLISSLAPEVPVEADFTDNSRDAIRPGPAY